MSRSPGEAPAAVRMTAASLRCWVPWLTSWSMALPQRSAGVGRVEARPRRAVSMNARIASHSASHALAQLVRLGQRGLLAQRRPANGPRSRSASARGRPGRGRGFRRCPDRRSPTRRTSPRSRGRGWRRGPGRSPSGRSRTGTGPRLGRIDRSLRPGDRRPAGGLGSRSASRPPGSRPPREPRSCRRRCPSRPR